MGPPAGSALGKLLGKLLGRISGAALDKCEGAPDGILINGISVGSTVGSEDGVLILGLLLSSPFLDGEDDGKWLGKLIGALVPFLQSQGTLNVYATLLPTATASGQYGGTNGLSVLLKLDS